MKCKYIISLPEDYTKGKSDEAIKAGIERRMASATPIEPLNPTKWAIALIVIGLLGVIVLTCGLWTIRAYAGTAETAKADMPELLIVREEVTWLLSDTDRETVESAVMAVAGGETELCMQAAAQAIRNACEDYGLTVGQVIEEWKYPTADHSKVTEEVKAAVNYVTTGKAVNERLHCFYNPNVQDGSWHENQTFVLQIGDVRFFA